MKKANVLRLVMAIALLLTVNVNVMGDNLRKGGSIVGKIESLICIPKIRHIRTKTETTAVRRNCSGHFILCGSAQQKPSPIMVNGINIGIR